MRKLNTLELVLSKKEKFCSQNGVVRALHYAEEVRRDGVHVLAGDSQAVTIAGLSQKRNTNY